MKSYKEIVHGLLITELANHIISEEEVAKRLSKGYVTYTLELQEKAAGMYAQQVAESIKEQIKENVFEMLKEEELNPLFVQKILSSIINPQTILP